MRYVIGIDVGTSGTKTVLFDKTGIEPVFYPLSVLFEMLRRYEKNK